MSRGNSYSSCDKEVGVVVADTKLFSMSVFTLVKNILLHCLSLFPMDEARTHYRRYNVSVFSERKHKFKDIILTSLEESVSLDLPKHSTDAPRPQ